MINKILATVFVFALGISSISAKEPFKTKVFSQKQKKEIEKIVYEYVMENPSIILEAVSKLKEEEEIEKAKHSKEKIKINQEALNDARSSVLGNKEGDIVIYHFYDYNCTYCKVISKDILKLSKENKRLRIMMKDSPIFGEDSQNASAIGLFAASKGKYEEFYTKIMGSKGKADKGSALKIIKDLKLSEREAERFIDNQKNKDFLGETKDIAIDIGVQSMPTTIIGDELFLGAMDYNELKKLVDSYISFVDRKETPQK